MTGEETLKQWIDQSAAAVFFGGAGVSTESGIPDFRSVDGLYHEQWPHPPEVMLSHGFFLSHTEEFFRFYRAKMLYPKAKPNAAHVALARLEARGKLKAVITQNIDGLHQRAGSKTVYELHGSVYRNTCTACGRAFCLEAVTSCRGIPRCACGGTVKPDVVLYGEGLDDTVVAGALNAIRAADLLIVGGTSLVVYPAAGLVGCFKGERLVLINKSPTRYDSLAGLVIRKSIGEVLSCAAE